MGLNEFTQQCLQQCTTSRQRDRMIEDLHPVICEAVVRGEAATRNWAETQFPAVAADTDDGGFLAPPAKKARRIVGF